MSNSVFVYPVAILLFSYFLPAVLDYYDHMEVEVVKTNRKVRPEIVFVGMAYAAGMLFVYLPGRDFCGLDGI